MNIQWNNKKIVKSMIEKEMIKQDETLKKQPPDNFTKPVCYESLTDEEFDAIIESGLKDYQEGRVYTPEEVFKELNEIFK